ncbi:hypothetical protein [Pseudodesulfovibrio sp. S3]|uniref:hypothetical protein n=1 Tax=Pseudodesulfovibrio sp. S3 TaxID=2283629 RepID=UPI0019D48249|nr:hypothetical protein [Pseudodesulfovibrio sp. S3]
MQKHANRGGDSGIEAFRIESDGICIQYIKAGTYTYTVGKLGQDHIDNMKQLALEGEGLNEYINTNRDVYNGWTSKGGRELSR